IPLVVAPPSAVGRPARRVAHEVVELRDVMPTLLAAAGLPVPSTVEGRSLIPLLSAPAADWRTYLHGEHCTCYAPEQEMQYVTDGLRKYVWLSRIDREQFFDLEADPGECHDLIADPDRQDEIALWRSYLIQELVSRGCRWVRDGELYCPPGQPLVSPYKHVRWTGDN
ncbi:MAG TPA: sulfatase/phosphatase domain-containing protein, partial [Anaerolineae bacterium]|nr:sulfatase/phosphatase domain-containing protein [Anaerolineae bacterium]